MKKKFNHPKVSIHPTIEQRIREFRAKRGPRVPFEAKKILDKKP